MPCLNFDEPMHSLTFKGPYEGLTSWPTDYHLLLRLQIVQIQNPRLKFLETMKGNFLVGQMVSDWQDMDYLAQIVPYR